jgi:hypothetical protein
MGLGAVAAGSSPHIGTLQSFIFVRRRVRATRMRDCFENSENRPRRIIIVCIPNVLLMQCMV